MSYVIVDSGVIEFVEPENDEIEAIILFEKSKKAGNMELNEFID